MARLARTPYDIGGVTDLVFAYTHEEVRDHDVFNGGLFVALPSDEAYHRLTDWASSSRWKQAEMITLNRFAATAGNWIRLPQTLNVFPSTLGAIGLQVGTVALDNVALLHFVGLDKVRPGMSEAECEAGHAGTCTHQIVAHCCKLWVRSWGEMQALLPRTGNQP